MAKTTEINKVDNNQQKNAKINKWYVLYCIMGGDI